MRRILITGASRGLGRALALAALDRGHQVFAAVRDPTAWPKPPKGLERIVLDVTVPASIAAARRAVGERTTALDLLINNAAIHRGSPEVSTTPEITFGALDGEGLLAMVRTNAVGPMLVTQAFADLLARGDRPVALHLSSRKGSLANKDDGGNYGYCASKAALNMVGRALAHDLAPLGVTSVVVHPGLVQTRMGGPEATLSPEGAARTLLDLAARLEPSHRGRFLSWDGTELPW